VCQLKLMNQINKIMKQFNIIKDWQEDVREAEEKAEEPIKYRCVNLDAKPFQKKLSVLRKIGNDIEDLRIKGNDLKKLPRLPNSLIYLDARYNNFSHQEKKRIIRECFSKGIMLKI